MDLLKADFETIGVGEEVDNINLKDLKRAFKKKSLTMLPEKHPTVPNAHTRFEEVNAAFVRVREDRYVDHSMYEF